MDTLNTIIDEHRNKQDFLYTNMFLLTINKFFPYNINLFIDEQYAIDPKFVVGYQQNSILIN